MARIGRQIPHYDSIDLNSIEAEFSEDKQYRYTLKLNFSDTLMDSGRSKSIAVIMKNPSSADEKKSDATIRKVETFVHLNFPDVRTIYILNLFAFRATEPGDLNEAFKDGGELEVVGEANDRSIQEIANEVDYLILAWGNTSGIDKRMYEERIVRVKHLLAEVPAQKIFRIQGKQETKHPLHGLMWGYDYSIEPIGDYLKQHDFD